MICNIINNIIYILYHYQCTLIYNIFYVFLYDIYHKYIFIYILLMIYIIRSIMIYLVQSLRKSMYKNSGNNTIVNFLSVFGSVKLGSSL